MKLVLIAVAVFCIVLNANADPLPSFPANWPPTTGPGFPRPGPGWPPGSPGPTFPRPGQDGPGFPKPGFPGPTFPRPGFPPSTGPTFPRPGDRFRFRREANPQSITLQGTQPLSGPDRNPIIDLNYNHRIMQDQNGHVDLYGGGRYQGGRVSPHVGVNVERQYPNGGFLGGYGQVQPGPGGRPDPQFGIRGGWRF